MENAIVNSVRTLLAQPPAIVDDKDHVITTSVVKSIAALSNINKIVLANRTKEDLTVAKKEDIATELTRVIFYTSCLSHALDLDSSHFDMDSLTEFSQEMNPSVQFDKILCATEAIRSLIDILHDRYSEAVLPGEDDEIEIVEGLEDTDEEETEHESEIAVVFACVLILVDILELDLEAIIFNVTTIEKL